MAVVRLAFADSGGWRAIVSSEAKRFAVLLVAMTTIASCGTGTRPYRDQKFDHPELNVALAFLRESDVFRTAVEARFGPPQSTFEGGRVVAYRLMEVQKRMPPESFLSNRENYVLEWKAQSPSSWGPTGQQLMIEYDKDGKVLRHNVLR